MKQPKKSKLPIVPTAKQKAASVIQDAEPRHHQRLLDSAAPTDDEEGIRQGLEDVAHGRTRAAREFFEEFRRKHGIPRWVCHPRGKFQSLKTSFRAGARKVER